MGLLTDMNHILPINNSIVAYVIEDGGNIVKNLKHKNHRGLEAKFYKFEQTMYTHSFF